MVNQSVRPFKTKDLSLLDVSTDGSLKKIFQAVLKKQPAVPFAAVVTLPYKEIAWQERKPQIEWPADVPLGTAAASDSPLPVVAMVTKGAMEVYQTVCTEKAKRRKTTVVLLPGMWFGLFEACAKWPGDWTITSGVVSFMVCNPIGTAARWNSGRTRGADRNYQFRKDSELMFERLVPDSACTTWFSESVWVRPDLVRDPNLRLQLENLLRGITINQLVSVLAQNPTWGQIGQGDTPDNDVLWMQYLDAVIDGHTPIFQFVNLDNDNYFPVKAAVQTLSTYKGSAQGIENHWDILVPKTLGNDCKGMHPLAYVSRFPANAVQGALWEWDATHIQRIVEQHGREIKSLQRVAGSLLKVLYSTKRCHTNAIVTMCRPLIAAAHPIKLLNGSDPTYSWHRYFDTVVIIDKSI